jgi:hypothetical protein
MTRFNKTKTIPGFLAILAAAATLATLTGCAQKAIIKPNANFLQNGNYRSRIEAAPGIMTGLSLQLNGNGRFSFATMEGGCFVAEDWGVWNSSQEELTLRVQKSMRRASCASAWQTVEKDTAFHCSMRNVTDRSFHMLHDGIEQGTVWTAWEREVSQGYAELERLRMEPEAETITFNSGEHATFSGSAGSQAGSETAQEKSVPGKARSGATSRR